MSQHLARDQSGQAVFEYILMLAIAIFGFFILFQGINRFNLMALLMRPLKNEFAMAYKYGHPQAKGWDEGAPEHHPRAFVGGNNFRIFINPQIR